MTRTLLAAGLLIAIAVAMFGLRDRAQAPRTVTQTQDERAFTGAQTCASCHPAEFKAWSETPHGLHATARAEPEGGAHLAIGSQWMQAYMRRDLDGIHRILPQCYDLQTGNWLKVDDVLRAIRGLPQPEHANREQLMNTAGRSFEADCSGCHASGTRLRRRARMEGRWRDAAIDCESCHGPGRAHSEAWARLDDSEPMPRIEHLSPVGQSGVCMRCHGGPPAIGSYAPGDAEHFIARSSGLVGMFSSGAAAGQRYQAHAFRRSRCHTDGGLVCSDCHESHGSGPRSSEDVDAMCSRCHGEHANVAHTHHDARNEGARCVSCHMPRLLDGLMAHQRDHRIGVPLPHAPEAPDACTACHDDHDKAWAAGWYETWYGPPPRDNLDAIRGVHLARSGKPKEAEPLLEAALEHPDPFFRWTALTLLSRPERGIDDPSPEVRLAAVFSAESHGRVDTLLALRADPHPVVRAMAYGALVDQRRPDGPPPVQDLEIAARQSRELVTIRRELAIEWLDVNRDAEVVPLLEGIIALGNASPDESLLLAAAYGALGRGDEARSAVRLFRSRPGQVAQRIRRLVSGLRNRVTTVRKILWAGTRYVPHAADRIQIEKMATRWNRTHEGGGP